MGNKTVFELTTKGQDEIRNHNRLLPEDTKRVLMLVDGESSVESLEKRAPPSLRATLGYILKKLENEGYIQNKVYPTAGTMLRMVTPKISTPIKHTGESGDLDFTKGTGVSPSMVEADGQARVENVRLRGEQEVAAIRVQLEAERTKAEMDAAKARKELEAALLEVEGARAELEAAKVKTEILAKLETEASSLREKEVAAKVQADAEEALRKAELERSEARAERAKAEESAAKAKEELEIARQETERARADLEATKVRAEALAKREAEVSRLREEEAFAKAQADAVAASLKASQEAELAKAKAEVALARAKTETEAKAKQDAEIVRRMAEEEVAKIRSDTEVARLIAAEEAELAKAKAEAEARAKQQAEIARHKAEEELVKTKAEAEAARLKALQETELAKAKAEAEERAKQQAEIARRKAEEEMAKARAETEAARLKMAQEAELAKAKVEFEAKAKQEDEAARRKAEEEVAKARAEAELVRMHAAQEAKLAKRELEAALAKVEIEAEAKIKREAEAAHLKAEQEIARIKAETEVQVRQIIQEKEDTSSVFSDKYPKHQENDSIAKQTGGNEEPVDAEHIEVPQDVAPFSIDLGAFLLSESAQKATSTPTKLPIVHTRSPLPQSSDENGISLNEFHINIPSEEISDQAEQIAIAQEQTPVVKQEQVEPEMILAKTQQEIEDEARVLAEQAVQQKAEAARILAEQEIARLKAEKEAREMADEQAKVWAEAKQRANAQATMQIEVEQEAQHPGKKLQTRVARIPRRPLPLGKIAASLLVFLIALIVAMPYVWPMQDYVAQLEKKLSEQLQQPVHIGRMKAALFPLPKLELQDISVGSTEELKASNVVLIFDIAAWFSEIRTIKSMEINDLALNADSFQKSLLWLQAAGSNPHYPVMRMVLARAHINSEELNAPPMNGNADWDAQGHFVHASLHSEGDKLEVELQQQLPRWKLTLHLRESNLPGLPGILFNELNLKGDAGEGETDFTQLDGQLYGGNLTGNARLSWQNGWQVQGRLNVKAMAMQKAFPQLGIEGDLDGDGSFLLNGAKLAELSNGPNLNGNFKLGKGIIGKIDLIKIPSGGQGTSGGRTHFDELSGTLQVENDSQHLRQLEISTQIMKANGSVDVSPGGQLSGQLTINLKMRSGSSSVILSGTLAEPKSHSAH